MDVESTTLRQKRLRELHSHKGNDYSLTWFIEEYPKSAEETRGADEKFWKRSKYENRV